MFWLIVHFEKCWAHVANVFTFFCLFLAFFLIWWVFQCHEGTDFYKQTFVSLVQNTSILMKKQQQWVFINVMYYSTAFLKFLFSKNVSYLFCLLRCTYFCLNGPAEKTKLLYFLHISHFNLLLKNSFCHLSHFDSLPLWIIKTFFKCSILLFCQVFFLLCNRMYSSFALFEPLSPPVGWIETKPSLFDGFDATLFYAAIVHLAWQVWEFSGSIPNRQ